MDNNDLRDLVDSIRIETDDDHKLGLKETQYKLPEEALNGDIIDAICSQFEHFEKVSVDGDTLILVHPEIDE